MRCHPWSRWGYTMFGSTRVNVYYQILKIIEKIAILEGPPRDLTTVTSNISG